ncbi:sugar nucleotide-binding protein [Patescibacteria group bacterium]|nr:sugar nucleotide-binding protein [Patescibacteria group bacterium]
MGTYYSRSVPGGIKVDLTDESETFRVLNKINPNVIIHAVGEPDPDVAKQNPEQALRLNVESVRAIGNFAQKNNCKIIHLSTAYVFPGKQTDKYKETEQRRAVNFYAETKVKGEGVIERYPNHIILRFDLVFGYNGSGKANGIFGKIINTKTDISYEPTQLRQPMFIDDIARAIQFLWSVNRSESFIWGQISQPNMTSVVSWNQ